MMDWLDVVLRKIDEGDTLEEAQARAEDLARNLDTSLDLLRTVYNDGLLDGEPELEEAVQDLFTDAGRVL